MIAELVQQADIMGVTGRESFRSRPVHWLIDLNEDGSVLGITATTASSRTTPKTGITEQRGKRFSTPANYLLGSPNQHNWRPDFLTGPADEIFPQGIDGTNQVPKKREDFWKLVSAAKLSLPENKTIHAVWHFLKSAERFIDLPLPQSARDNLDWFRKGPTSEGETLGFRVDGILAWKDRDIHHWWDTKIHPAIHAEQTADFAALGTDAFQSGEGRITGSSPCVFGNIPLVSFGGAPFCSYGLGDQTARLRLDTVEKSAAALNALRQSESNSLNLGDETAVFWAVHNNRSIDCGFINLLESDDPLAVSDYLKSAWGSIPRELNRSRFHIAVLLSGTGRFSVRSLSTEYLGDVDRKLRGYFEAIRLPGIDPVNLGAMARCTIPKTKKSSKTKPASTTYEALFESAWRGSRLPIRLLENITKRQSIELSKGFSDKERFEFEARLRARIALIKLYFYSNSTEPRIIMNEITHATDEHPAYLCGRVLAVLDSIHNEARKEITASSPASRYYGSASSTPALVFPRLCKLARIHLDKIENSTKANDLDHNLTRLVAKFAKGASWPRTLALEDQGRFAIGFYYERSQQHQRPS